MNCVDSVDILTGDRRSLAYSLSGGGGELVGADSQQFSEIWFSEMLSILLSVEPLRCLFVCVCVCVLSENMYFLKKLAITASANSCCWDLLKSTEMPHPLKPFLLALVPVCSISFFKVRVNCSWKVTDLFLNGLGFLYIR